MRASASARLLAGELLSRWPLPGQEEINKFAACLSMGNGGMRIPGTQSVLIVLGDVTQPSLGPVPPLVVAKLRRPGPGSVCTTELVAHNFREAVRNEIGTRVDGFYPPDFRESWAPIPLGVTGWIPYGGPQVKPVAQTIGIITPDLLVDWADLYPLDEFPIGCIVWRLTEIGTLVFFQRVQGNKWLRLFVPHPRCLFDLPRILGDLMISRLEPTDEPLPLLFN
jgi:hypothetical protein